MSENGSPAITFLVSISWLDITNDPDVFRFAAKMLPLSSNTLIVFHLVSAFSISMNDEFLLREGMQAKYTRSSVSLSSFVN